MKHIIVIISLFHLVLETTILNNKIHVNPTIEYSLYNNAKLWGEIF